MEELFHDRLPEFYEILAYHYSLSENFRKAYEYLKLSGDKAVKNYSNWEAIRFYKEAIRVLDTQPESEENQREKLNLSLSIYNVLFILGFPEGTLEILHEAEKLAQDLNDGRSILTVFSRIGHYHSLKGNPSLGIKYSEKSLDQAEKMKDIEMMAQTARYLCLTYFATGNYINLLDISNRTINLIEGHQRERDLYFGVNVYSVLCGWCGHALSWMGKCNEVENMMNKGLKIAQECNDKYGMGYVEQMHSVTLYWEGDGSNIIDHAQRCIKYWEEGGVDIFIGLGWVALGAGYSLLGEYETAKAHVSKGLNIQKKVGQPFFTAWSYTAMAMTHFIEGDLVSAKECTEEALKHAQESESKNFVALSWILLGRISGETDSTNIDEAQRHILHGISILEDLGINLMSTIGYLHLGELFAYAGRRDEALENLKKAEAMYLEMKVTPKSYWLKRTQEALAKLE